ncbi:zinc finger BED domain-containing protein RICESLEEPER 1-like [Papaver somniferum]|uniref:zinc finger BED domain-containing protein RICESLEEPER 1-like n=1 Tax=Papaver somniferum TaxID=3469 RepID=UPI000E6F7A30|nr:zinc finger BED domain-containing protein RICESLEEPER 1-like [Papaver somniferum]
MELDASELVPFKKPKRLTSLVWNDFERVKRPEGMFAICKHCKKKLSGSSTSGTSHLRNHLKRCMKRTNHDIQQMIVVKEKKKGGNGNLGDAGFNQDSSALVKFEEERSQYGSKFDQERSRYDLARMIILHEYPLAIVEHIGFKRFVENLQPSFQSMSCDRVKDDCMQIYSQEKQKLLETLDKVPGRISLRVDSWNSLQDHGYFCLTAHYIDENWTLQKKVLNFVNVDPYTEYGLTDSIMTCLRDWDIDRKLFSVTRDTNCTGDTVVSTIGDRLWRSGLLKRSDQLFHVQCVKHVINLIVQDLLESIYDVTHKIRESVRYVKSSESLQRKFNELAQQLQVSDQKSLCLDCPINWNSTYLMLEAAVECRDVFSHFAEYDFGSISESEWDRVTVVTSCLKLLVEETNVISGVKFSTANRYFPEMVLIHLKLTELCKSSDFAPSMKNKFDGYWSICVQALAIAVILDPRFKMKIVEYYYPQIYDAESDEHIRDVSNSIKGLYDDYMNVICPALSPLNQGFGHDVQGSDLTNGTPSTVHNGTRDRLSGFDKFLDETTSSQHLKSELDKYLEEPVFPRNVDFDILNWWKVNSPKYPVLSMMARDVLGIPMSTEVALDSAFNTGGRVLDSYRSSLSPDILQALVCTHDWFRTELEGWS